MNEIRKQGVSPIIVDSGNMLFKPYTHSDFNQDSEIAQAELIWNAQEIIGLDAFTPGAADFIGGVKLLEGFRDRGKIPFLAANLQYPDGKQFSKDQYVVIERNGVKIGVFGLLSETIFSSKKDLNVDLKVADPIQSAGPIVGELSKKSDVIVLLSELSKSELDSFCEAYPQVQFVIAGNNVVGFSTKARRVSNTFAMQGVSKGKSLSRLDLMVIDDEFEFQDESEYDVAKRSFERYERDLEKLKQEAGGEDPAKFFANDERKLARYNRVKENYDKFKEMLSKQNPNGSRFTVSNISLGKSVPDDQTIKNLVDAFELKWGLAEDKGEGLSTDALPPE